MTVRQEHAVVVDQGLSTLSNFVFTIVVARSVTASEFGRFSMAYLLFMTGLGACQAASVQPLFVKWAAGPTKRHVASEAAAALGASVSLSIVIAIIMLAGSIGLRLGWVYIVMAGSFPVIVFHDAIRHLLVLDARAQVAIVMDVIWLAIEVLAVGAMLVLYDSPGIAVWAGVWAFSGFMSLLMVVVHVRPYVGRPIIRFWRQGDRRVVRELLGEFVVMSAGTRGTMLAVGALAGYGELGGLRLAQTFSGPVNVLQAAVRVLFVPSAVRAAGNEPRALFRWTRRAGFSLAGLAAMWFAGLWLVPSKVGEAIVGSSWQAAHGLFPWIGVAMCSRGLTAALSAGIRATGSVKGVFSVRLITTAIVAVFGISGTVVGEAEGAAVGLAAGGVVGLYFWRRMLIRTSRSMGCAGDPLVIIR